MSKRCAKEDCKRWAVKGNNVEDGGLCLQCAKEASGVKDAPSQRDLNNQIKALGIVKHGPPSDDDEPPANPWAKPGAGRGPRPADDVPIWEREVCGRFGRGGGGGGWCGVVWCACVCVRARRERERERERGRGGERGRHAASGERCAAVVLWCCCRHAAVLLLSAHWAQRKVRFRAVFESCRCSSVQPCPKTPRIRHGTPARAGSGGERTP